ADHVVVRDAGEVPGRVQSRHGGRPVLVHPHAGGRVAAAQADLGDVHLHVVRAVVVAPAGVEDAAGGPFRGVQDVLQGGQALLGQVGEFQVDGPAGAVQLTLDLGHHLAGPVVGVDEPLAPVVDLVATERVGHVGARRA